MPIAPIAQHRKHPAPASRWARWFGVVALYAFFLVAHNAISDAFHAVRRAVTDEVYTRILNGAGAIMLLIFIAALTRALHRRASGTLYGTAWLLFGAALAFNYRSLIVFPAEYIHFIQYVLFTLMVYSAAGNRWHKTVIVCAVAAVLDEAWQTRATATINLRDVLLNMIGIFWAGLIVWTWRSPSVAGSDHPRAVDHLASPMQGEAECSAPGTTGD